MAGNAARVAGGRALAVGTTAVRALEAIVGRAALRRAYTGALRRLYLWREFGGLPLILPEENAHGVRRDSNGW
ncbi:hypothetical protein [Streptomyces sp. A5-4]|uniref:hypothetical protein n=1 Tax=Streptomyces sp. A5-4 TaxID=3384771 RepID=UPI003DA8569A